MLSVTVQGLDAIVISLRDQPFKITLAAVRAMNRGMASGRTVMVKAISQDMGLKSSDVRDGLKYKEATTGKVEASLAAGLKRIGLIDFKATGPEPSRGRGRGVSYRLQGSRQRIEQAFIATTRSGHRGVFRRTGKGRLPIVELHGPSLGHVFNKFRQPALTRALEMFQKNFGHELAFQSGGFVTAGPGSGPVPDAGAE